MYARCIRVWGTFLVKGIRENMYLQKALVGIAILSLGIFSLE